MLGWSCITLHVLLSFIDYERVSTVLLFLRSILRSVLILDDSYPFNWTKTAKLALQILDLDVVA